MRPGVECTIVLVCPVRVVAETPGLRVVSLTVLVCPVRVITGTRELLVRGIMACVCLVCVFLGTWSRHTCQHGWQ